jgi:hypothetical protein
MGGNIDNYITVSAAAFRNSYSRISLKNDRFCLAGKTVRGEPASGVV